VEEEGEESGSPYEPIAIPNSTSGLCALSISYCIKNILKDVLHVCNPEVKQKQMSGLKTGPRPKLFPVGAT